jgi:ankyrin repeat protein
LPSLSLSTKYADSWTILHYLSYHNNLGLLIPVLNKKVELDEQNEQGRTALMLAAERGNIRVVVELLSRGAKIGI